MIPVKILISLPSCGTQRTESAVSLARTMLHNPNVAFDFDTPASCYIHENREQSALKAIVRGADYLFFIDSDVSYPPDGLTRLLAHDVDIVGGNYHMQTRDKRSAVWTLEDKLYEEKDGDTIFKSRAVPGGFLLIKVAALRKIKRPWFFLRASSHPGGMIGEDVWFCDTAREHGYDVWCDPTIHIDHIGIGVY